MAIEVYFKDLSFLHYQSRTTLCSVWGWLCKILHTPFEISLLVAETKNFLLAPVPVSRPNLRDGEVQRDCA
jgi:hypothetical protein